MNSQTVRASKHSMYPDRLQFSSFASTNKMSTSGRS